MVEESCDMSCDNVIVIFLQHTFFVAVVICFWNDCDFLICYGGYVDDALTWRKRGMGGK